MENQTQMPVVEQPPVKTEAEASQAEAKGATEAPKASPAQGLRDIQNLLLGGIFPGNVAPAVVQGYQLLEKMAQEVERQASESK